MMVVLGEYMRGQDDCIKGLKRDKSGSPSYARGYQDQLGVMESKSTGESK